MGCSFLLVVISLLAFYSFDSAKASSLDTGKQNVKTTKATEEDDEREIIDQIGYEGSNSGYKYTLYSDGELRLENENWRDTLYPDLFDSIIEDKGRKGLVKKAY